jgi:hypothetical protein
MTDQYARNAKSHSRLDIARESILAVTAFWPWMLFLPGG